MRTATLGELRARTLQRGGFDAENSRFPPSEVNGLINESITKLYDLLVRTMGTSRFEAEATIATVDGTALYDLPVAFLELLNVSVNTGTSRFPLERYARYDRARLLDTNINWVGYPLYFADVGDSIELLPTPAAVYSVTVRYVPAASKLVDDAEVFDGINGWEEFVIIDACRKLAVKDRDNVLLPTLSADLQEITARIEASAPRRDRTGPKAVVDVRRARARCNARGRW